MDNDDIEQDTDRCEHRCCQGRGVGYDHDGRFLCEECYAEWSMAVLNGDDEDED